MEGKVLLKKRSLASLIAALYIAAADRYAAQRCSAMECIESFAARNSLFFLLESFLSVPLNQGDPGQFRIVRTGMYLLESEETFSLNNDQLVSIERPENSRKYPLKKTPISVLMAGKSARA